MPAIPNTAILTIPTTIEIAASVAITPAPARPDAINNASRITPDPVVPPTNTRSSILDLVEDIAELKRIFRPGEVRLHTALLLGAVGIGSRCTDDDLEGGDPMCQSANTAGECEAADLGVERIELQDLMEAAAIGIDRERSHIWSAALTRTSDDFGAVIAAEVAVEVAGRDKDTAGEVLRIREEADERPIDAA